MRRRRVELEELLIAVAIVAWSNATLVGEIHDDLFDSVISRTSGANAGWKNDVKDCSFCSVYVAVRSRRRTRGLNPGWTKVEVERWYEFKEDAKLKSQGS